MWELGIPLDHFPSPIYKWKHFVSHSRPELNQVTKIQPKALDKLRITNFAKLNVVAQLNLWTLGTGPKSIWALQLEIWIFTSRSKIWWKQNSDSRCFLLTNQFLTLLGCILRCIQPSNTAPMMRVMSIGVRDHRNII